MDRHATAIALARNGRNALLLAIPKGYRKSRR